MNRLLTSLKSSLLGKFSKRTQIISALALVAIAGAAFILPNQEKDLRAEDVVCSNAPGDNRPHLNAFPVKWDGTNTPTRNANGTYTCYDFPFAVARNTNGSFPHSQQQHRDGVSVQAGDMVEVRLYIHNSASAQSDPNLTAANNVTINTSFTSGSNGVATISANATADNASERPSGTAKVNLPANTTLELIADSGRIMHYNGTAGRSGFQIGDNSVTLFPTLEGCFEKSKFVFYKFRVVGNTPPTGSLTINKEVRNITRAGNFSSQTVAKRNEVVEYRISVNALTNPVANVTLTDTGAAGVSQTAGTLRLNGQLVNGNLQTGLGLGTLNTTVPGVVTYRATVTSTACNANLVNTARASAPNQTTVQDTATVVTECDTPPPVNVVCAPSTQTRNINESAFFTATGGTGSYSWTASGSTNPTGTGSSFNTRYATSGTKTVVVTSGNQSDTCTVVVREVIITPDVVCTPATQTRNINETANFTATGGNGTYSWVANGSSNLTGTGSSFNTSYATSGTKTVTVSSGGKTDSCAVIVRDIVNPNLVCAPSTQTRNINEFAFFTATGGTGSYSWTASGSTNPTGTGSSFNTRYATSGTKTVVVTSGNQSDTCTVVVRDIIITGTPRIAINKLVKNVTTGTSFQNSVNASFGDRVQFEIVVTSVGTETANNVVFTDPIPSNLNLDQNSVRLDGSSKSASSSYLSIALGNMTVGQSRRIVFDATVNTTGSATIRNVATATSSNANTVDDDAYVFISTVPGNPNLQLSKKVRNDRTGQEGTVVNAEREDYLTYTLTVTNTGNAVANNFVVTDDLSGILAFADMIENGGGTVNGQTITYPSLNVAAGSTITKTFRVRVKYHLTKEQSYVLRNTYGNLVTVNVPGKTDYVAPKTGSSATSATVFAGLLTSGFVVFRKRRDILKMISA